MSGPARRRALPAVSAAAALALALGACTPEPKASATPEASGTPLTVVHGGQGLEPAVAAVLSRHLRQGGHAVTDEDGVPLAQPAWTAADAHTVAVVDTLRLAVAADPAAVLPAPPEPSPEPTDPVEAGEPGVPTEGDDAPSPADPGLPTASESSDAADASATPEPTPLPDGEPAADAAEAGRVVERLLQGDAEAGASPEPGDAVAVLGSSAGVLRLSAVVTATTAARLELDALEDLNGRCEGLTAALPAGLAGDPQANAALHARLDRLAGCRPGTWREEDASAAAVVVADQAQLGLLSATDPEIPASMLVPLEDPERVLPEGRLAAVGAPDALDDDAQRRIEEVLSALDEDGLRELERITTGADALPPAEAARYWLVDQGLEDVPEGWFMPRDSWF